MSKPTFENIDRWFFEYTEGNLTPAQESQLMSFVSVHPELNGELEKWTDARVTPIAVPASITAGLTKATPFFVRPAFLIEIGIATLLFGLLLFQFMPTKARYKQNDLDSNIINVTPDKQWLSFAKKEDPSQVKASSSTIEEQRSSPTEINDRQENELFAKNFSSHSNVAEEKTKVLLETKDKINTSSNQYGHLASATLTSTVADLGAIKEYLTATNYLNTTNQDKVDQRRKTAKIISSDEVSKFTLKRVFRKIQRMSSQPVALQNTKNPHFHVPNMSGFSANYAMVGSAPGKRIQATSRIQWMGKENSQFQNSVSYDSYIYGLRGGLGIDVNYSNYQSNALNKYAAGLTYSPKFSLNKNMSIEPAVRFKMGTINLDENSSLIGSNIEMNRTNITPLFTNNQQPTGNKLWYKDIGAGLMLNTKWFYAGVNADNLGRHNTNFYSSDINKAYRDNIHYTAVIGTEYKSSTRDLRISGYGFYQNYGELEELWVGANLQYKWLQIGGALNNNLDFGASTGIVTNQFSLYYNIDKTQSRLLDDQFLSHQLTLKIVLKPSRYAAKFLNL